jgi:hypothetical protein
VVINDNDDVVANQHNAAAGHGSNSLMDKKKQKWTSDLETYQKLNQQEEYDQQKYTNAQQFKTLNNSSSSSISSMANRASVMPPFSYGNQATSETNHGQTSPSGTKSVIMSLGEKKRLQWQLEKGFFSLF